MCFTEQLCWLAPIRNLTLIRTVFEIVELDEKLHDAHPHATKPKLPASILSMPMPSKRKSGFLNTLSRLTSPSLKLPPTKPSNGLLQTSIPATTLVAENLDPSDTLTTRLATYFTNIANDQIHRQTKVWRRFVLVKGDDLESIRVERAIERVRSDLAAHLERPSTNVSGPILSLPPPPVGHSDNRDAMITSQQIVPTRELMDSDDESPPQYSQEPAAQGSSELHSFPSDTLNPLGLLAETGLAMRKTNAEHHGTLYPRPFDDPGDDESGIARVGVASEVYFKPGQSFNP